MVQTQLPVIFNFNNAQLNGRNAMPQKDITSDGTNDFSRNRRVYWRFLGNPLSPFSSLGNTTMPMNSLDGRPRLAQMGSNVSQKKWGNTNRDASQIAMRKRVTAVGKGSFNAEEQPLSITTTRSINTEYDAIVRCRAGGYCVPKKVTQKNILKSNPQYFRVVSFGLAAVSSGPDLSGGLYKYTPNVDLSGTLVKSRYRSYSLVVFSRQDDSILESLSYDLFDTASNATLLKNKLNSLNDNVIVLIYTFDEPKGNAYNNADLQTAFQRCGGSANCLSQIQYRGAYVLLGIPGIGLGKGVERYVGTVVANGDPNAWIDMRFSLDRGRYTYISG